MNDFDALLAELNPLVKSMETPDVELPPVRDDAGNVVAKAAKKPAAGEGEGEGEELLGKSFPVTMPDGTVTDAYDGTEIMKSMALRLTEVGTRAEGLEAELVVTKGELTKALTASTGLLGIIKGQAELLKSLRADVDAIGAQGRGRTTVAVLPQPQAPQAAPAGPQLLAKAMTLHGAGEMSSVDVARIEARLNNGMEIPPDLLARLAA